MNKINDKLKKIDRNIELAKKLRNEEIYNMMKEIDKKYASKINQLNYEKNQIQNAIYLNGYQSAYFIEYIVNQIEDEKYNLITIPVKHKGKYLGMNNEYLINGFYVCGLLSNNGNVEIKMDEIYTEEELNQSYENFFRLYHYNKKFGYRDNIQVNYLVDKYPEYCNNMSSKVDSCLLEDKFPYIKDFIKIVIDYKLDKEIYNDKIDLLEIYDLAKQFVNEYKDTKKLKK